jgi:steroid 5-alpha reductase family enzyme
MACLITVWGIRLTFNFYRRGGYTLLPWKGEEDYRWAHVRQGVYLEILTKPVVWHLFNLTFISIYQNVLLLLIATPSFVVHSMATSCKDMYSQFHLWGMDGFVGLLILFFILIETIADNQQFHFQSEKARVGRVGVYSDGFCQKGLFAVLRKPHYAAEQAIWISFYLFTAAATSKEWVGRYNISWVNYSIIGSILLCLLFQGSASLTESITANKYPRYKQYQQQVPLFVPRTKLFKNKLVNKNK